MKVVGADSGLARSLEKDARMLFAPAGLLPFGWVELGDDDGVTAPSRGLLIGNIGSSHWLHYSNSEFAQDGEPDGMDRWTVALSENVAAELGAVARYPFGSIRWPFQDYAKRATGMNNSPLGLLIHPQFGLWTALRALLVFDGEFELPDHTVDWHPCDRCVEKPCLSACPVDAFSSTGYAYEVCKTHVRNEEAGACRGLGCRARLACPVGQEYAYEDQHQAFHMQALIR